MFSLVPCLQHRNAIVVRENMLQSHELQIVRHSYSVKRVQNSRGFVRPRKLPCEDED